MVCDKRGGEAGPGIKMATLDGAEESGWQWAERTGVEKCCEVLLCGTVPNCAVGGMVAVAERRLELR